jgi:glycosyltransferase involved in cell wall biosynthesis
MASKEILISVLMPVYNAEKYLKQAIDSILHQTYIDFELLIFNDASTDKSLEIIKGYTDQRIKIINSPINTGYVKHLNHGLSIANGKYIARMDADDIAHPERFEKQLVVMEKNPNVGVCGSNIEIFGDRTEKLIFPETDKDIFTRFFIHGNSIAHPSVMMRKNIIEKHRISYNQSLEPAEDYDMWIRISEVAELYNIQEPLLEYRWHTSNESVLKKEKQDNHVYTIRESFFRKLLSDKESDLAAPCLLKILSKDYINKQYLLLELDSISKSLGHLLKNERLNKNVIAREISVRFSNIILKSTIRGTKPLLIFIKLKKAGVSFKLFSKVVLKLIIK